MSHAYKQTNKRTNRQSDRQTIIHTSTIHTFICTMHTSIHSNYVYIHVCNCAHTLTHTNAYIHLLPARSFSQGEEEDNDSGEEVGDQEESEDEDVSIFRERESA